MLDVVASSLYSCASDAKSPSIYVSANESLNPAAYEEQSPLDRDNDANLALLPAHSKMNPASEIVYRPATAHDLHHIGDLRWRLKTEDTNDSNPLERAAFITAFVNDQTQSTAFLHWVAEGNDGLIAVMSIARVPKLLAPHQRPSALGYLTNCYTLPLFRRCGIGRRLLSIITDWAREQEFELLLVWPSDESYNFYERFGFKDLRDPLVLPIKDS